MRSKPPVNVSRTGIAPELPGASVILSPRERQAASCVATAEQALTSRRRLSEYVAGRKRRTTATVYRQAWVDFALWLRWRLGDEPTPQCWASADPTVRKQEAPAALAYLDGHVGDVTASDVQAYVEALLARPVVDRRGKRKLGLENATVNLRLAALAHLLKTAFRMGLRADNAADALHVSRRRVDNPYRASALSMRQAAKLLAVEAGTSAATATAELSFLADRDHMVLVLLLRLGLRREEVSELRADSFHAAPEAAGGGMAVTFRRKGDTQQTLLVPEDVASEVTAYVERWSLSGFLFPSCSRGNVPPDMATATPMSPNDVTSLVRRRSEQVLGTRIGPHTLRHTFATAAIDAGAALHDVQHALGHTSAATTERYIKRRLLRKRSPAEIVTYREGGGE